MSERLTEQYNDAARGKAKVRLQRLQAVRAKTAARLQQLPSDPRAARWSERLKDIDAAINSITIHGQERISDRPVGCIASAPSLGA